MKIKYLDQTWHYKPEYQLEDFIRVNELDEYSQEKLLKIMVKLYALYLDENYPWNFNPYEFEDAER